ncbi:MAG: cell division protein FtsA [Patescibacteria group bacterium]
MKKPEIHNVTVLDIGTKSLRLLVLENQNENKIIAATSVQIDYIKRGVVQDIDALTQSIRIAISQIHKIYLAHIDKVVISLSGVCVGSIANRAEITNKHKAGIITENTIQDLYDKVEARIPESIIQNKKVVHIIPQEFRIDGKKISTLHPQNLRGAVIDMKALCIFVHKQHLDAILCACEEVDLIVDDVVIGEYAFTKKIIREADRLAGACIVNIGADTTTVTTYDEGVPLLLDVFPIGSQDITKDLALGLKVPIAQAEQIKLNPAHGLQYLAKELTEVLIKKQNIAIKKDQREKALYMNLEERYHEIVYARLIDIFELVQQHVRKIKKDKLLPAGVIIHGAGGRIEDVAIIAKEILHLPVQVLNEVALYTAVCKHKQSENIIHSVDSLTTYASGVFYLTQHEEEHHISHGPLDKDTIWTKIFNWCKQFLP